MSAARKRGLVRRGASLCKWDGAKYVKVFSPRREVHLREIDADIERMRCPWFGVPASGMDAPDWMFSGGYVSIDENHSLGVPGVVMRAGS